MGINPAGHLNVAGGTPSWQYSTTYVGLRYIPTNGESTAPGCLCEGWGVANADAATGSFAGYANVAVDGVVDLQVVEPGTGVYAGPPGEVRLNAESVGTHFRSIATTSNGRLRVTHDYHPSSSPNLYEVTVTIENTGTQSIGDLRYRRVMDWDIAPYTFYEWVEIHVGNAANLHQASTNGFSSANPLASPMPWSVGSPPTILGSGSPDYFGGPSDQGALFDFKFGALAPGTSKTFTIYYGAAANHDTALAAISSVGAEVYSFGIPSLSWESNARADTDGPHVFIFAFKGVGGVPVAGFLTPATDTNTVGTPHTVTATITVGGAPAAGVLVNFAVTGANPTSGSCTTGSDGTCSFTYTGTNVGSDSIVATATVGGSTLTSGASKTWTAPLDTTAPIIVPTVSPSPNAAGWNNTNVNVSWSVSDPESGIASSSGCGTTTLTAETPGRTLTCSATNGAGLSNSVSVTVKIDKTAPTISGSRTPGPNAFGWNNTDVTVSFSCSDGLSGIGSCGPTPQVVSAEGAGQSRTGTAVDVARNTTSFTVSGINIDKTAPVADSQNVTTAEDTPLTITLTSADSLSSVQSYSLVTQPIKGSLTGVPPYLTYTPFLEFNGGDSFTFTATDLAGNTSNPGTVSITVTPVNDPPQFDPIADQTVTEPQDIAITGVLPGPLTATDESGQPVTLRAAVTEFTSITNPIANLTITPETGTDMTRTLSYQRALDGDGKTIAGTATITVTADDGELTFSRSFTITLANASTELTNSVVGGSAPASSAGYVPGEPIVVAVSLTFPTIDFDGDGFPDCYRVIPPNPYNVIARVDGQDATQIPEGLVVTISEDLPEVCGQPLTLSTNVTLTNWYPDLLKAEGTHNYTLSYVNFARDPEGTTCLGCFTILEGSAETSGSVTVGDQCPDKPGEPPLPFGAGAGGTGCPVADKNTVTLHTVNLGRGPSTKAPAAGAVVRVFDRNSPAFRAVVATLTGTDPLNPANKNPDGSLYGRIFEANQGVVGTCVTANDGVCFVGEAQTGDYLVIVKFSDDFTDATGKAFHKTVYVGRPKSPTDFVNGVAEKDFQIIKVFNRQGVFQEYRGGSKMVVVCDLSSPGCIP